MKDNIVIGKYDNIVNSLVGNKEYESLSYFINNKKSKYILILLIKEDNQYYFIVNNIKYTKINDIISKFINYNFIFLDQKQLKKTARLLKDFNIIEKRLLKSKIPLYTIEKIFGIQVDPKEYKIVFKSKDPYQSYKDLVDKLTNLFNINLHKYLSLHSLYISKTHLKTKKYLKKKSLLDDQFEYINSIGYSEVFVCKEDRSNRLIYVLDINSTYPYQIIKPNYPDPSNLIYSENKDLLKSILSDIISNGLFDTEIELKSDSEFIKYLPFNYVINNYKIPINIKKDQTVSISLTANEIKYYSKYYDIKINSGIYSKKGINHPLKKNIEYWYKQRLLYKDSPVIVSAIKSLLVSYNSFLGQNRVYKYKRTFNSIKEANNFFLDRYKINIDLNNQEFNSTYHNILNIDNIIINDDLATVEYSKREYNLKNNLLSLSNTVLSNAKCQLIKTYDKIYHFDKEFELCYANIDSLHISIPKSKEAKFLRFLDSRNLIGTKLGQFKIEAKGNRGLWLDVGKYWIYDQDKVIKWSSSLPVENNDKYVAKTQKSIKQFDKYGNVKYFKYNMFKNIRYSKYLNILSDSYIIFDRLKYHKIKTKTLLDNNLRDILLQNFKKYQDIFNKFFIT